MVKPQADLTGTNEMSKKTSFLLFGISRRSGCPPPELREDQKPRNTRNTRKRGRNFIESEICAFQEMTGCDSSSFPLSCISCFSWLKKTERLSALGFDIKKVCATDYLDNRRRISPTIGNPNNIKAIAGGSGTGTGPWKLTGEEP